MKRVFIIVLDSFGVGAAPDAANFRDIGANTLHTCAASPFFDIKNLINAGLGNIDGIDYLPKAENPTAAFARLRERSTGKDTTIGHWEIAGIVSHNPLPTFPNGFPDELLASFQRKTGCGVLCNRPYSGTEVIKDFGRESVETGKLIVYTSADSVFQIAAHEDIVPPSQLYDYCRIARSILTGEYGVGRVIARPFCGSWPYQRTSRRHDFSLEPPRATLLDDACSAGKTVFGIGKIYDIFAGKGITDYVYTTSNADGMTKTLEYAKKDWSGICFVNLVDFDMLFGHRRDIDGYAKALHEFDAWLPTFLHALNPNDVLIITADHGCDPGFQCHTDHTREDVPLMVFGQQIRPQNMGTVLGFDSIASTVAEMLNYKSSEYGGTSLFQRLIRLN